MYSLLAYFYCLKRLNRCCLIFVLYLWDLLKVLRVYYSLYYIASNSHKYLLAHKRGVHFLTQKSFLPPIIRVIKNEMFKNQSNLKPKFTTALVINNFLELVPIKTKYKSIPVLQFIYKIEYNTKLSSLYVLVSSSKKKSLPPSKPIDKYNCQN